MQLQRPKKVVKFNDGKFIFKDINLAIKTRKKMRQHLIKFDLNRNQLFEEEQIRHLLMNLLKETEQQLHYAVKNVFRYDRDNDGSVTYQQFTNFSVQQHFGQMAIQRLHKNNLYSQGSQRKMNIDQFCKTLQYCLQAIQSPGTKQNYQQLFRQVDLDRDGWISYEDYFIFLKEYFGSKSAAATVIEQPPVILITDNSNTQSPQKRIARLVYSQLKILVMLQDTNKNRFLTKNQISAILNEIFSIRGNENQLVVSKILQSSQKIGYEQFMKKVVQIYLIDYQLKKNYPNLSRIEFGSFPLMFWKALSFIQTKPSQQVLQNIFKKYNRNNDGFIVVNEYIDMITNIFNNYEFDRRGISI